MRADMGRVVDDLDHGRVQSQADGDTTMASDALFTKLKSVDQDDTQIYHDLRRGDTDAVIDKDRETRPRREPMVGLWFWAIE